MQTRRSSCNGFGDRGKRGDGGVDIIPFTDKDDGGFGDEPYSAASAARTTLPTLDRRQEARSGPGGHHSDSKRRQAMRSSVATQLERNTPMEGEHSRIDPFLGGLYSRTNRRYLEADEEGDAESQTSVFATAPEADSRWEKGVAEDALRNNDGSDDGISVVPHAATSESGWTAIDSQPISKSTVIASAMEHSSPESPISTDAPTVTHEKRRAPPPPIRTLPDLATRNTSHTGRTMFVRHQDAGMLGSGVDEVIDLPPLYTEVAHGVHASEDRANGSRET
ncbi:hypothetical protein QFC22_002054 [Naganishia vaughanmartiniae]|uniref:Uncharacterized protein n=1 Tax=Naganishia vaughanmartiniae TaxID=1424756 RepID=A0ACC2XGV2_9TREE|nr:hypothetical protein QFC22_002054 [Naganishia vaughanmartiniae]